MWWDLLDSNVIGASRYQHPVSGFLFDKFAALESDRENDPGSRFHVVGKDSSVNRPVDHNESGIGCKAHEDFSPTTGNGAQHSNSHDSMRTVTTL
jgi:hypothetical protein